MTTLDVPPRASSTPSPARRADDVPLVSVVIPVRDGRATLSRALRSIVAQDYSRLEVVIVDDGSVDDVRTVVDAFPQLDLKLNRLESAQGVAIARNRGLALASGEFVAFLDADDEWLTAKTRLQVAALSDDRSLVFTHAGAISVVRGREMGFLNEGTNVTAHGAHAWKTLLKHGCVVTSSVMVRRGLLLEVGAFDGTLSVGEDQDLWIRLALRGPVHYETGPLIRKHNRPSSIMNQRRDAIATVTLPMIEGHVARLGDRLSTRERVDILGYRRLVAGRNCYEAGHLRTGATLVLSAARAQGLLRSGIYLASASPIAQRVKRILGRRRQRDELLADLSGLESRLVALVVDTRDLSAAPAGGADWLAELSRVLRGQNAAPTFLIDETVLDDQSAARLLGATCEQLDGDLAMALGDRPSGDGPYKADVEKLMRLNARSVSHFGQQPVAHVSEGSGADAPRVRALCALGYEVEVAWPMQPLARAKAGFSSRHPHPPRWLGEDGDLLDVTATSPRDIQPGAMVVVVATGERSRSGLHKLEEVLGRCNAGGMRVVRLPEMRAEILRLERRRDRQAS